MSDEIHQWDKQEGRKMGWHGKTDVNPELSLANCHLNKWDYTPKDVMVDNQKTGFRALGVTDVPGLIVGRPYAEKSFKPITNKRLMDELSDAIGKQGLSLESCGTLFNRGRQFFSFSMDAGKFQAANRPFESFLNIGNGNDMSCPLWVNTSNICTVCNNTFTANLDDKGMIMKVKKTKFSEFKISELGSAVQSMLRGQAQFAKTLNELASIECSVDMANEIFAGFIGEIGQALSERAQNTIDGLLQLFATGKGNNGKDMSDVFSAFTDHFTHEAASGKDDQAARWKNHLSSEFGAGRANKVKAWDMLTKEETRNGLILMGKGILAETAKKARE